MKAKKSLGQNFLKSKSALDAVIDTGDPAADDIVLEIGPGEGVLTEKLLIFAGKVIAIEKDRRLVPFLKEKFKKEIKAGKFDIVEKDILEFDEGLLKFYAHPYKIIANIPYYITGQVIKKFLESKNQPESMTLLLQKEVAERILAKDKKESLLSISVKIFGTPKYIKTVGRGAFSPQPNVDSAILHIGNISKSRFTGIKESKFFEILRKGFSHKRKLLIKNLISGQIIMSKVPFDISTMKNIFKKCGIPEKVRAENLSVENWICLTKNLL